MKEVVILIALASACAPAPPPDAEPPTPRGGQSEPPAEVERGDAPSLTGIAGDLPPEPPAKLERHATCRPKACGSPMADGDAPAALWSHRLEPTSELALPSNPDLVLYGVVVAGAVAVGNDQVIGTWHAFRAPGVGVKLAPDGDRPADVVLAFVSDGQAVRDVAKRRAAPGRGPELLDVVDVNAKEDLVFAKGSSHVRIAFEDGPASLQIMLASKDAPVPRHEHAKSWEVIGLLQGNGSFSLGGKAREVTTQTILAIPPATDHAFAPAGDTGLLAVQLYVPPGPEQRFKELAAGD